MQRRLDSDELQALKKESQPPPKDETDALVGALLGGRYRVIRKLAEGSQASVYLARHTLIKRQVAIKVLAPSMAADRAIVRRFLDEAQIVGTMGHPNIVESIDVGVTDDARACAYIVLEFLEGSTIATDLARGVFEVGRAAYVAKQIASGLDAAHHRGIIHRDLKPENVFLIVENAHVDLVKLIDFGISKLEIDGNVSPSQRNLLFGTPEYMAPEQITHPTSVDARADIYALGTMLYEMLVGKTPFEGIAYPEIMDAIIKDTPRPLGERRPGLPPGLIAIVDRCLRKRPEDRYARMADVEEALKPFAVEPPLETKSSRIEVIASERRARSEADGSIEPARMPTIPLPAPTPARAPAADPLVVSNNVAASTPLPSNVVPSPGSPSGAPSRAPSGPTPRTTALLLAGVIVAAVMGVVLLYKGRQPRPIDSATSSSSSASPSSLSLPAPSANIAPDPSTTAVVAVVDDSAPTATSTPIPARNATDGIASPPPPGLLGQPPAAFGNTRAPVVVATKAAASSSSNAPAPRASESAAVPKPPEPSTIAAAPTAPPVATPPTATATVQPGTIDPKAVGATVRGHTSEAQSCYDRARMHNGDLHGRVAIRATVDPSGAVTGASIGSTTAHDTRLENCLVGAFRTWKFPPPAGGVPGAVSYTFVFE